VLGFFTTTPRCQAATPTPNTSNAPGLIVQPKAQPAAAEASKVAFPSKLLPVGKPGVTGAAPLGINANELWTLTRSWYQNDRDFFRALKNASSELGRKDVPVEAFFLYKHAITNEQYEVFIKATGHRSPFHWWKWGNREDFLKHQPAIAKLAEDLAKRGVERGEATIRYWEENHRELKFKIPAGAERHPAVFVSYNDAMAFCGWAGMRLPTEAEWTYAATAGKRKIFLFGDKWDPKFPTKVGLSAWRDRTGLKPVGFLGPNAAGPFGHQDMLGQVWEWVLGLGYGPPVDEKVHEKEYDKLRRQVENDKRLSAKGRTLPEAVAFNDDRAMAKGSGSFYSFSQQRWDELRLNVRAPLSTDQTVEGLGFRPAKSHRAALDMTLSRLRAEYVGNQYFLIDQRLALADQDGIERYDLEKSGTLITNYHAISFIPINFLTREKSLRPRPLEAHTKKTPVILGALITTEAIKSPALKKGIYTVYYRHAGLPKGLVSALKEGGTVLKKEELERIRAEKIAKRKKKKDSKKKEPKKEEPKKDQAKKKKGPDWRKVIARYGFVTADFKDEEGKINRSFWKDVDYVYLKHPCQRRQLDELQNRRQEVQPQVPTRRQQGPQAARPHHQEALQEGGASRRQGQPGGGVPLCRAADEEGVRAEVQHQVGVQARPGTARSTRHGQQVLADQLCPRGSGR
jgi:formylglycine-generating enzyme required for sulfatase activity